MTDRPTVPAPPLHVGRPLLPPLERWTARLADVWAAAQLTNGGAQSRELERRLATLLGTSSLALTNNGTTALLLGLAALELEGEVVTTPLTFAATPHSLVWNRLEPVFADVDPATGNLDPRRVAERVGPRTSAILAVHLYGTPCDVAGLQEVADRHGLRLVFDAAHAVGTTLPGDGGVDGGIGACGDLSAFSLHSTKLVHSAEGGVVTCRDPAVLRRVELLRNFGIAGEEPATLVGLNGKLSEIHAALGLAVLDALAGEQARRRELAELYREELADLPGIEILAPRPGSGALGYFALRIDEAACGASRDAVHQHLRERQIFARRYFYPLCSDLAPYRDLPSARPEELPEAHSFAREVLCLPFHGAIDGAAARRVSAAIREATGAAGSGVPKTAAALPARRPGSAPRPRVSVTMPAYCNAAHIERAIDSVLAQSFADLELIVVDDGSHDDTLERVRRYDDPRLVVVEQEHQGGAEATNAALAVARGDWIALFAADDECHPERLERQLRFALAEDAAAVFSWVDFIDDAGAPHPGPHFAEGYFNHPDRPRAEVLRHFFFAGNYLATPSALIDRRLLVELGGFSPTLAQLPDFATWLRLVGHTDLRVLPERLLRYRIRDDDGNVSSAVNQVRSHFETRRVYRTFFDAVPVALFREAFAGDLRHRDFAPGIDLEIEKALLFLRHPVPGVRLLGPELLSDLLRDPAARRRARERYDLGTPELFDLTLGLDVGHAAEYASLLDWALELEAELGGRGRNAVAEVEASYRELESYARHLEQEVAAKQAGYADLERYARQLEGRLAALPPAASR